MTIMMAASQFYSLIVGGGAPYAASDTVTSPASANASVVFKSDGTVEDQDGASLGDWLTPSAAAHGGFEIRATANPDTPDAGTMNSWLALSSDRTWSEGQSGIGVSSKTFQVEIRDSEGNVQCTDDVDLTAEVDT